MEKVQTIASVGDKGGGGKTTNAMQIGVASAAAGRPTYLIDCDHIPDLTRRMIGEEIEVVAAEKRTVFEWLTGELELPEVAIELRSNLFLIPGVETILKDLDRLNRTGKSELVRRAIRRDISDGLVILDTHPGKDNPFVEAAARAADLCIIAAQTEGPDAAALPGMVGFLESEKLARLEEGRSELQIRIVLTRDHGQVANRLPIREVKEGYPEMLVPFIVPDRAEIREANLGYDQTMRPHEVYSKIYEAVVL